MEYLAIKLDMKSAKAWKRLRVQTTTGLARLKKI